jgi:protein SCO1/2
MRLAAPSLALLLALIAAACGSSKGPDAAATTTSAFRGTEIPSPRIDAPDFALRDQDGKVVRMAGQRGRAVVVAFLYTKCPDVCPLIAGNLNAALRRLGPLRPGTRVLAVSVDPKNDTPVAVRRYVRAHRLVPEFRYLTGTRAQLGRVWKAYHVAVVENASGSTVGHTTFEVLVDARGVERALYDSHVSAADVVHDVRALRGD